MALEAHVKEAAPETTHQSHTPIDSPRVQDLESRIEALDCQVRRLSRHLVVLEHDLAIRRLESRLSFGARLQLWLKTLTA